MPGYFIRRLTREDEGFLWEMLYHALYVPDGQLPFPRESVNEPGISKYVLGWGREGDQGFAAIDRPTANPIGAAWFRSFAEENQGYGYVDHATPELSVAVLPGLRGRGIGADLLRHLIEEARPHYPALSLSVSPENPAVRLYRRLGFEVLRQDANSLTMKKELGGTSAQV